MTDEQQQSRPAERKKQDRLLDIRDAIGKRVLDRRRTSQRKLIDSLERLTKPA